MLMAKSNNELLGLVDELCKTLERMFLKISVEKNQNIYFFGE